MSSHFPDLHYILNKELTELYASIAIRRFTLGLISIFVPIYLYIYFSENITKTLFYFAAISILYGLLSPLAGKLITKFGVKHSMLYASPFLFLYYLGLWQIDNLGNLFFLLIPTLVIHNLFYWPAFHIDFARFSNKKDRSKQLSYRHTVLALSAAASPLIGGSIIATLGFNVLFAIVLVLLFVSVVPLFFSSELHESYTDSLGKAHREVFNKKYRGKVVAFFGEGVEVIIDIVIWPIFLFTLAINFSSIGFISSIPLFVGVLFALYIGRLVDKMGHARLLSLGAVLNAISWPVRMLVATPIDAIFVNTFHKFTRLTAHFPLATLFYDWVSREDVDRDKFIILREIVANTSRGLILSLLAVMFLFVETISVAFLLAGLASLLFMFFTKGPKIKEKATLGSIKFKENIR